MISTVIFYFSNEIYELKDENKNPLETEFGLCTYKDHQTFSIQVFFAHLLLSSPNICNIWLKNYSLFAYKNGLLKW